MFSEQLIVYLEMMFHKTFKRKTTTRHGLTFYQYEIINLDVNKGARLRFNSAEQMTSYLIPSERNINFERAINIINKSSKQVKECGHSRVASSKKISKLNFLDSMKKMINKAVESHEYKEETRKTFTRYLKVASKASATLVKSFTELNEFYDLVDSAALEKFNSESDQCFSKVPTIHEAIMFWKSVTSNKDEIETSDDAAMKSFEAIKRTIIEYLLMCKNTSEMERSFSLLHTRHGPVTNFSTSRDAIFLRQFARQANLFNASVVGLAANRNG